MEQKNIFCRTDLASEWQEDQQNLPQGVRFTRERLYGREIFTLHVDSEEGAQLAERPVGCYQTVEFDGCLHFDKEGCAQASALLSLLIKRAERSFFKDSDARGEEKTPPTEGCVLIVGLGNRSMTADAVGPLTVERVMVTNHVRNLDPALFEKLNHRSVAAIAPGVLGQTGIESASAVRLLADWLRPRMIIVIDALAARSIRRLGTTVQISTGGIAPGSGVGNDRPAFTKESMGVPVLALGVPTVADSSTLVADALEKAGIEEIPPALLHILERGKSFFVSLKEVDAAVDVLSRILADAIDDAMDLQSC